jgi:hypothetical protein
MALLALLLAGLSAFVYYSVYTLQGTTVRAAGAGGGSERVGGSFCPPAVAFTHTVSPTPSIPHLPAWCRRRRRS